MLSKFFFYISCFPILESLLAREHCPSQGSLNSQISINLLGNMSCLCKPTNATPAPLLPYFSKALRAKWLLSKTRSSKAKEASEIKTKLWLLKWTEFKECLSPRRPQANIKPCATGLATTHVQSGRQWSFTSRAAMLLKPGDLAFRPQGAIPSASRSSRQNCPPMPFHLWRQQLSSKIVTQTLLLRLVVRACIPELEAEAGELRASKPGSHGQTVWDPSTLVFRVHHNSFSVGEH